MADAPTGERGEVDAEAPSSPPKRKRGRPRSGAAVARHLDRDEELLVIAAEVFYRLGYEGTRLDDVASSAGIVKGSLYHYFQSKEHIYQALVSRIRDNYAQPSNLPEDAPASERMELLIRSRIERVTETPVEVGILARQMATMEGPIGDWTRKMIREDIALLRRLIVEGQRSGEFRAGDPELMARTTMGIWLYPIEWIRADGEVDKQLIEDEVVAFVMAGLAKA